MSQYDVLDALIIERLRDSRAVFYQLESTGTIRDECSRLAELSGRQGFRILDGRLIALRKKGLIGPSRKHGWGLQ